MFMKTAPLLSPHQHTLAKPTGWVSGTTLRNLPARVRFLPALSNSGRSIRILEKGILQHEFNVTLAGSQLGHTWTDAIDPATGQGVGVIEHPAAAVVLAGLDNVIMEVDYPKRRATTPFYAKGKCSSVALMNGTATPYLEAINKAGVISQNTPRSWHTFKTPLNLTFNNSTYTFHPRPLAGWSVTLTIPAYNVWWRKNEVLETRYDLTSSSAAHTLSTIANARPANYTFADYLMFKALTLGTARKADFAVMHAPWGNAPLDNQSPYSPDESVHHNHLDFLGDLFFFTGYLQADITVYNPHHPENHQLRQWLLQNPASLV